MKRFSHAPTGRWVELSEEEAEFVMDAVGELIVGLSDEIFDQVWPNERFYDPYPMFGAIAQVVIYEIAQLSDHPIIAGDTLIRCTRWTFSNPSWTAIVFEYGLFFGAEVGGEGGLWSHVLTSHGMVFGDGEAFWRWAYDLVDRTPAEWIDDWLRLKERPSALIWD
ncbi:MAG: hypothetical protein Pars93KO_26780 [Parasphingorhabdus sp.]